MTNSDVGIFAEDLAARTLERRGYEIITQNYRRKWGEVDVIARKDGILIFVEVKASQGVAAGFEPELRANREKMQRVVRAARTYLAEREYPPDQPWQIDVIAITLERERGAASVKHFKNIEVGKY